MPSLRTTPGFAALWFALALAPLVFLAGQESESPTSPSDKPGKDKAIDREVAAAARIGSSPRTYDTTDPADDRVRFLVLLRQGPLIVEAAVSQEGKSFRYEREKIVDRLLAAADTDRDGKPTWQEAGNNRVFQLSGFSLAENVPDAKEKARLIKTYDRNADGVVDRTEARGFISRLPVTHRLFGSCQTTRASMSAFDVDEDRSKFFDRPSVNQLLDTDASGVLSAEELAEVPSRLKYLDSNHNEVVEPEEIESRGDDKVRDAPVSLAIRAGETTHVYELLRYAAEVRAGRDSERLSVKRFPLLKSLDRNGNGLWEAHEADALLTVRPHLMLAVDMGKSDGTGATLTVKPSPLDPSLRNLGEADDLAPRVQKQRDAWILTLPGARIELRVCPDAGLASTHEKAKAVMAFDVDSNGYIDKREVERQDFFVKKLDEWDHDKDGKVYLQEIKAAYDNEQSLAQSLLTLYSVSMGRTIYEAIDTSGDGRLGQRELRQASAQLARFDENRDGKVALSEIPECIALTFGKGIAGSEVRFSTEEVESDAPAWFTKMDRNRDGDLSPREFLGDAAAFRKLDADGDKLVSVEEAKAAEGNARPPKLEPQRWKHYSPEP